MTAINILMSVSPGPDSQFVEVETDDGHSICVGKWRQRDDGLWSLRIDKLPDEDGLGFVADIAMADNDTLRARLDAAEAEVARLLRDYNAAEAEIDALNARIGELM